MRSLLCASRAEHYDLVIRTDLAKMTFSGTVVIDLAIHSAVPAITLHAAAPLKLYSAALVHGSLKTESTRPATLFKYDEKKERVTIEFAGGEVAPGTAKLALRFDCALLPSMKGFYVCLTSHWACVLHQADSQCYP